MSLSDQILTQLKAKFGFKSVSGAWLQQGTCPSCGKKEVFCASDRPIIVKCGRIENCGWEDTVRNLLPELFEDWSKRAPATETNPTATADAYLTHERGLNLMGMRGAYTQELYREGNAVATTVRFPLGEEGGHWERIIDRPGRFGKKAHFRKGKGWGGRWWQPPTLTMEAIAQADEIWLAEGIFDAWALNQVGIPAVSLMSVNNYPADELTKLKAAIATGPKPTHSPTLVFAFDVGKAGVEYTRKFVKRASDEGWHASAAQVRPDGEGTKLDWNDLLLRHQAWRGDPDYAPLSPKLIEEYRWNGRVTIATSAREKAKLMHQHRGLSRFDFRFDNRMWSAKVTYEEGGSGDKEQRIEVEEIANCAFRILYVERDDVLDETHYFIQIDFPDGRPTEKQRFSSNACAASGEFKKRLMAFSGMWAGTSEQLDRLMRLQTRRIKKVEPLPYTGYAEHHDAWVLGDIAVRDGRMIELGRDKYFDFGKSAVKLRTPERILSVQYDPDQIAFDWVQDVWEAWGERGIVTLTFFVMSLFAVQIRREQQSLGFLEVTGEPGSGKTTLITFLWKLMGREEYEGFNPNIGTVAGVTRNFLKVSNLPVGLIEGTRDDSQRGNARQFDWSELLTLYNGRSPRVTGARTGGSETVEPPFLGSIYLMQNKRIDAIPAVLERLMSFEINKTGWNARTKVAARRVEKIRSTEVSGTIVHIVRQQRLWLDTYFACFDDIERAMETRNPGLHNSRIIKNHAQLAAAMEATAAILPMRAEWLEATERFIDAMALDRQLSSGSDHPLVQRFWDQVEYLLAMENRQGFDIAESVNRARPAKRDQQIAIHLVQFDQKQRNANLTPVNIDEVKRLLTGSRRYKFIEAKNVNMINGQTAHCWVFARPESQKATD